jgi:hypothetical protein
LHGAIAFKRATYILRAGCLKLDGALKERLQEREYALPEQAALQAGDELEVQLHVSPLTRLDLALNRGAQFGQNLLRDVGLVRVGDLDDGSNEGRLERLLNNELERSVDEDLTSLGLLGSPNELTDGLRLLVPASEGRLGECQELLSESDVHRRRVVPPLVGSPAIIVIVICTPETVSVCRIFGLEVVKRAHLCTVASCCCCLLLHHLLDVSDRSRPWRRRLSLNRGPVW